MLNIVLGTLLLTALIGCESSQNKDRLQLLAETNRDIGVEDEKQETEALLEEKCIDVHFNEKDELLIETLEPIRTNFKRINSMENWTSIEKIDLWETTEEGQANFYYNGQTLEKIVVHQFGETRQRLTEYYLQNEYLSFVFDKWIIYNRPLYWDSLAMKTNNDDQVFDFEKSEITEERSYFANTKLIHKFDNEDCNAPFSEEYLNKEEARIMAEFEKIADLKKNE